MNYKSRKIQQIKDISTSAPVNNKVINKVSSQLHRHRIDFAAWRSAISSAENESYSNFYNLQTLYREISEDSMVYLSQTIRRNSILSSDYKFFKNGSETEDEKLEEYFDKEWFKDFISYSLDSIFYGYSAVQIDEIKNDEVISISNLPRQNVNPKTKMLLKTPHTLDGDSLENNTSDISDFVVLITPKKDSFLGLYNVVSPYVISKRNAVSANNEYLSKFGIPNVIYQSNIQDEDYRNNIEDYLSNFSNLGYLYGSKEDEIKLLEASNNTNDVFLNTIKENNKEISKIITGGDISADKAYVGSVEAQERLLNQFYHADKKFIEGVVNNQLIPKLINLGLKFLVGVKFEFCEEKEDDTELFNRVIGLVQSGYQVDAQWINDTFGIPVSVAQTVDISPTQENQDNQDV